MEIIHSLFKRLEQIAISKENLKDLIYNLNQEINRDSAQIYRLENIYFKEKIIKLENKKRFLEDYSFIPKDFFKDFFKKIPSFLFITIVTFAILIVVILFGNYKFAYLTPKIIGSLLAISGAFSLYGIYLEPIVINYRERKDLLNEYGSLDNIDLKINELIVQQEKTCEEVKKLKDKRCFNQEKLENYNQMYENYGQIEIQLNQQIECEFNKIWNEICHERYIYDVDLNEPIALKLNKK